MAGEFQQHRAHFTGYGLPNTAATCRDNGEPQGTSGNPTAATPLFGAGM